MKQRWKISYAAGFYYTTDIPCAAFLLWLAATKQTIEKVA